MTAPNATDLYKGWVAEAKQAVAQLKRNVMEAKHNEQQCCEVLSHALEAVMSLESAVFTGHLKVQQRQQLPDIVAAILSSIQLAQSAVQVNSRHCQLSSCTLVAWSRSSRKKLSFVSNSLKRVAQRTRELQIASLEEPILFPRSSLGQEVPYSPRHSGFTPQRSHLGNISTESVQAMKQALERFSIDKEGDRAHPQGQGQLAAAGKPTQPRPSFSDQIRASFIRPGDTFSHPTQAADISSQATCTVILKSALMAAGLPHSQLIATSSQSVPEIGLAFMGQSVAEAPSMAGQTAAGFARRSQVLETKDVPSLLRDQASPGHTDAGALSINRSAHMTLPEPRVTDRKLPLPGGVDHNRDVTISHRGTSVPATVTNQITVSTSPVKVLNPSAAAHLVQKSESLSRRASLAAKLQRMAESADVRSTKASDTSDGTSTKATSHSSQASSPAHISTSSDGYQVTSMMPVAEQFLPRPRTSLDRVRRAEPQEGLDPSAEQTSNAVDSMAADIRRRHLTSSSEREKTCSKKLQLPGSSLTDSIHQSNTGLQGGLVQTDEGLAMQPGHLPSLRRTLSDAAAQALDVVESMLCPIIPFSQLQIQRKIGDGSIGQVYLAKWRETDVAVKVITQMQNLSCVQGVHPQDPLMMSNDHECLSTAVCEMGLSDVELTAITTLEKEVSIMAAIRHPNVAMLMGLCLSPICVVTEFCARGSLTDVLRKAASDTVFAQQLVWRKRITMALDAAKGMLQLHSHPDAILHRDLKSPNLLVDRHWRVKVTDFNLSSMVKSYTDACNHSSTAATNPRWLAPEVVMHQRHSKAADVYSFGIVLWELLTWQLPWDDCNHFQIMILLTREQARPEIPDLRTLPGPPWSGVGGFVEIMQACWHQDPDRRPPFESVIASLRSLLVQTTLRPRRSQEMPNGGGSGMLPDSPRQLTPEAGVPLGSSVTTLSRSGSSHSHIAHMSSPDPNQETFPKQAPAPGSLRSPFENAAKQMTPEHTPSPSADEEQEAIPQHSFGAGSRRSPFETAAKQMSPEHMPSLSSKQEIVPKHAPAPSCEHSPYEMAAMQMAPEHIPNPSSDPTDKHAAVPGSKHSSLDLAAMQMAWPQS